MLMSSLCNYSDAYILASARITVPNIAAAGAAANHRKNIIIKNCAPITNCMSKINNTQIVNAKDIDLVMPMYNLIEYSDNYSKNSRSFWHYYRDESFLNNGAISDFPANNNISLKFKTKTAGRAGNDGTKSDRIRVPFKYLSNFWRTLQMPLINCEIILNLTCSDRCFTIDNPIGDQVPTFTITDTNLYVPVIIQDNAKLLHQLKSREQLTGRNMSQK